jgi:uncharacterized membrane protein
MKKIKILLLKYRWYVFAAFLVVLFCATLILFSSRKEKNKVESMASTLLDVGLQKKTEIIEEMLEYKIESIGKSNEELDVIREDIKRIREEKESLGNEAKFHNLRELSNAFKSLGY